MIRDNFVFSYSSIIHGNHLLAASFIGSLCTRCDIFLPQERYKGAKRSSPTLTLGLSYLFENIFKMGGWPCIWKLLTLCSCSPRLLSWAINFLLPSVLSTRHALCYISPMQQDQLTFKQLAEAALELGATPNAIRVWRQRGIPHR